MGRGGGIGGVHDSSYKSINQNGHNGESHRVCQSSSKKSLAHRVWAKPTVSRGECMGLFVK